jgi:AFG3 family protein
MVAYYRLDKEIGPISFYDSTGQNGRMFGKPYSENRAELIVKEVQDLIITVYENTKNLLLAHRDELKKTGAITIKKRAGLSKGYGKPTLSTY